MITQNMIRSIILPETYGFHLPFSFFFLLIAKTQSQCSFQSACCDFRFLLLKSYFQQVITRHLSRHHLSNTVIKVIIPSISHRNSPIFNYYLKDDTLLIWEIIVANRYLKINFYILLNVIPPKIYQNTLERI